MCFFSGKSSLWLARWSVYHWYIKILWNRSFLGRPVLRYSLLKFVFYLISRSEWSPWKYYRKEEKDKNSNNKKVTKVSVCSWGFLTSANPIYQLYQLYLLSAKLGIPLTSRQKFRWCQTSKLDFQQRKSHDHNLKYTLFTNQQSLWLTLLL